MIKFSRREDYAVILVNKLAQAYNKRLVPLSEIAKEYGISLLFLRNLANDLRNADVVRAVEGKKGGYYLTKDPKQIKMGDILSVFSKNQFIARCPAKNNKDHQRICPNQEYCVVDNIWRQLNKEFIDKIYNLSLEQFLKYR